MSNYLTPTESNAIAARIAEVEARTSAQVVVAFVGRADRYPEAHWKAFALGVSIAALTVVTLGTVRTDWEAAGTAFNGILAVLAAGLASALAATYVPRYTRLFVRHNRAEAEARQYAEGLFLDRGLFAIPSRTAVLVLASLFERVVVVHADTGFAGRVDEADWERVVTAMTAPLRAGDRSGAAMAGLAALESLLLEKGFAASALVPNAVPDRPLEERGP